MTGDEFVELIRSIIEWAALGIEVVAVVVIVTGVVRVAVAHGTVRFLFEPGKSTERETYRYQLGKTLLLGLEFLVAADVVRTVALEPSLSNVAILGILVVIRTFLSWSLTVEIDGRWPWQSPRAGDENNSR